MDTHRSTLAIFAAFLVACQSPGQADETNSSWLQSVESHVEPLTPRRDHQPGHLAMSPDDNWIAASSVPGRAFVIYKRNTEDGRLKRVAAAEYPYSTKPAFSPDSRFLYVPGTQWPLEVYALGGADGLTRVQAIQNGKENVVGMRMVDCCCLPPDGRHLYVSHSNDRTIVCFERDPQSGKLTFQECLQDHTAKLPRPGTKVVTSRLVANARQTAGAAMVHSLKATPDGTQLYSGIEYEPHPKYGQFASGPLVIWDRDLKTGRLTIRTVMRDKPGYFEIGIKRVVATAFTRDGKAVITVSNMAGVSLFSRNPADGALDFQQIFLDPQFPIEPVTPARQHVASFKNPVSLAMFPDESGIIVASVHDHALHLFDLDPELPELAWKGTAFAKDKGHEDFFKPQDLAISPDGRFLYVSSSAATVAVYEIRR